MSSHTLSSESPGHVYFLFLLYPLNPKWTWPFNRCNPLSSPIDIFKFYPIQDKSANTDKSSVLTFLHLSADNWSREGHLLEGWCKVKGYRQSANWQKPTLPLNPFLAPRLRPWCQCCSSHSGDKWMLDLKFSRAAPCIDFATSAIWSH